MIRLGSFSPTLRAVFFTISVHKETTKLFPIFLKIVLLFTFCFCRSIFFLFHCVTLHPNHISILDYHSELYDPCVQLEQVRVCGGFLSVIPAYDFVRCFGPCGGGAVRLLIISHPPPLSFLTCFLLPFPLRCSTPNHISILDAFGTPFRTSRRSR